MERVLFFARIDLSHILYSGLKKKIAGQKLGLEKLGYEVDLVHYDNKGLLKNDVRFFFF